MYVQFLLLRFAAIVQLAEQPSCKRLVAGSMPAGGSVSDRGAAASTSGFHPEDTSSSLVDRSEPAMVLPAIVVQRLASESASLKMTGSTPADRLSVPQGNRSCLPVTLIRSRSLEGIDRDDNPSTHV